MMTRLFFLNHWKKHKLHIILSVVYIIFSLAITNLPDPYIENHAINYQEYDFYGLITDFDPVSDKEIMEETRQVSESMGKIGISLITSFELRYNQLNISIQDVAVVVIDPLILKPTLIIPSIWHKNSSDTQLILPSQIIDQLSIEIDDHDRELFTAQLILSQFNADMVMVGLEMNKGIFSSKDELESFARYWNTHLTQIWGNKLDSVETPIIEIYEKLAKNNARIVLLSFAISLLILGSYFGILLAVQSQFVKDEKKIWQLIKNRGLSNIDILLHNMLYFSLFNGIIAGSSILITRQFMHHSTPSSTFFYFFLLAILSSIITILLNFMQYLRQNPKDITEIHSKQSGFEIVLLYVFALFVLIFLYLAFSMLTGVLMILVTFVLATLGILIALLISLVDHHTVPIFQYIMIQVKWFHQNAIAVFGKLVGNHQQNRKRRLLFVFLVFIILTQVAIVSTIEYTYNGSAPYGDIWGQVPNSSDIHKIEGQSFTFSSILSSKLAVFDAELEGIVVPYSQIEMLKEVHFGISQLEIAYNEISLYLTKELFDNNPILGIGDISSFLDIGNTTQLITTPKPLILPNTLLLPSDPSFVLLLPDQMISNNDAIVHLIISSGKGVPLIEIIDMIEKQVDTDINWMMPPRLHPVDAVLQEYGNTYGRSSIAIYLYLLLLLIGMVNSPFWKISELAIIRYRGARIKQIFTNITVIRFMQSLNTWLLMPLMIILSTMILPWARIIPENVFLDNNLSYFQMLLGLFVVYVGEIFAFLLVYKKLSK